MSFSGPDWIVTAYGDHIQTRHIVRLHVSNLGTDPTWVLYADILGWTTVTVGITHGTAQHCQAAAHEIYEPTYSHAFKFAPLPHWTTAAAKVVDTTD